MTSLFPLPPATGNLTPRQQLAHDLLAQHPDGLTATDVGWTIHKVQQRCRYCHPYPCKYAAESGKSVLNALRARKLVIRRRTGRWQLTHPVVTGSQTNELPEGF